VDDKVTLEALHLADAAILVLSGLQPGGHESVRLAEQLRVMGRKVVTVITRIDQVQSVEDIAKAFEQVRTQFGNVSQGDPIGVASPGILSALERQRHAKAQDDQAAAEEAQEKLRELGYQALRERLQEGYFDGIAASTRAQNVLRDVAQLLRRLSVQAQEQRGRAFTKAEGIAKELTVAQRHLNEVLKPKRPLLEAKIDEYVDKHVSGFISDLADALDVFIERVLDGGVVRGVQSVLATFSKSQEKELLEDIRSEFRDLFPDYHLTHTVDEIARAVKNLMELEWQELAKEVSTDGSIPGFDPSGLVQQICQHLAEITAYVVGDMAAWFAILFLPGGVFIDVALLFLAGGVRDFMKTKETSRTSRIKRDAKVRLKGMRRQLVAKLGERFRKLNDDTAARLIERAQASNKESDKKRLDLLLLMDRWLRVEEDMHKLMLIRNDLAEATT
jgi:translation initiation factor 1 (eIF-1/SUI1)